MDHPRANPWIRSAGARWLLLCAVLLAAILAPFVLFEEQATQWTTAALDACRDRPIASGALVASLLVADVVLPVPSSLVGVFAGSVLGWIAGGLVVWGGMTAGGAVAYGLGRGLGGRAARSMLDDRARAEAKRRFDSIGPLGLALTRGVPVLAEAGAISAGATEMKMNRFLVSTVLGNGAVEMAYAGVGATGSDPRVFMITFLFLAGVPVLAWTLWSARRGPRPSAQALGPPPA